MRRGVSVPSWSLMGCSLVACTGSSPGGQASTAASSEAATLGAPTVVAASKDEPAEDFEPPRVAPGAEPETDAPTAPSKGRVAASLDASRADVESRVSVPNVALLRIAAEHGDGTSMLWVQPITPEGTPVTAGTRVHTTTGEVDSIAAAYDGVTLWVAWRSLVGEVGERRRGFVGLAGFEPRLVSSVPAKTLRTFEPEDGDYGSPRVRMIARPATGEGVVVAALVGTKRCRGMFFEDEGHVDCNQLGVDVIGGDGSVQRRNQVGLEGGDPRLDALVDAGDGVVTAFHAWRGGPMTDVSFTAYGDATGNPSACEYPPIQLAWVDGGLLSICPDPDDEGSQGRLHYASLDGTPRPPSTPDANGVPITRLESGCAAGRPVARVSWKGGHLDVPAEHLEGVESRAAMVGTTCKGLRLD